MLALEWDKFGQNLLEVLKGPAIDSFCDVTLACEEGQVKSHKLVLAASSPIFHDLLTKNPHPQPLIYLKGTSLQDLQALLSFAYCGMVELEEERLESFLKAAEELQVKGLTKGKEGEIPLHPMLSDAAQIDEDNDGHQPQELDFCSLASPAEDQTDDDVVNEEQKQPLLYRDPALPLGWYIKVKRTHIAKHRFYVENCFFSPDGALLRSQSDVSSYLEGKLRMKDKSYKPPLPVAEMPWKDDLAAPDKLFVPNLENLTNIKGNNLCVNPAAADDIQGIQVSSLPVKSDPNDYTPVRSTDINSSSAFENNNFSQSQDCDKKTVCEDSSQGNLDFLAIEDNNKTSSSKASATSLPTINSMADSAAVGLSDDQQKVTYTVTGENGYSQTYMMICSKTLDQNTLVNTLIKNISNNPNYEGRKTVKITQYKNCAKKLGKRGKVEQQGSGTSKGKKQAAPRGAKQKKT